MLPITLPTLILKILSEYGGNSQWTWENPLWTWGNFASANALEPGENFSKEKSDRGKIIFWKARLCVNVYSLTIIYNKAFLLSIIGSHEHLSAPRGVWLFYYVFSLKSFHLWMDEIFVRLRKSTRLGGYGFAIWAKIGKQWRGFDVGRR